MTTKIKRPLINPGPEDEVFEYKQLTPIEVQPQQLPEQVTSPDQLQFKINSRSENINQWAHSFKMFLSKRQEVLEVSSLWKSPALPFAIISGLLNIFYLLIGGIFEFDRIPNKIPFFYNSVDKHWEQVDKSTIFIFGIMFAVLEFIAVYFIMKIFRTDKRFGLTISWVLTLLNTMLLIAIIKIYSLTV